MWGLTISGFYYIALHRQTGRIEGLYYDPGSQPFQRLGMLPEGSAKQKEGIEKGEGKGEDRKRLNGDGDEVEELRGKMGRQNVVVPGAVRRYFPSVEFR